MVSVHFNDTAYNNEKLTIQQIKEELVLILKLIANSEMLLDLDAAAFHKTPKVKKKLKDKYIVLIVVPPNYIGILQPLDTSVNKPFKKLLQEETKRYIVNQEN